LEGEKESTSYKQIIKAEEIKSFFKYSSFNKQFQCLEECKKISLIVDGIVLSN